MNKSQRLNNDLLFDDGSSIFYIKEEPLLNLYDGIGEKNNDDSFQTMSNEHMNGIDSNYHGILLKYINII